MIEEHRHTTNKLVKQTLKQISRTTKIPYAKVIEDFKNGSEYLAYEFWKILEPQNSGYNCVTFCHTCKNLCFIQKMNNLMMVFLLWVDLISSLRWAFGS